MYHDDVVPTDVFIWGADAHELWSVRRIAAYQPGDGRHVGALRVEFSFESGLAARTVGEEAGRRLLGAENFNPVWDGSGTDDSWVPFEIDGAGGEMVVAVEVAHDEDIQAVMVCRFALNWFLSLTQVFSCALIVGERYSGVRNPAMKGCSRLWSLRKGSSLWGWRWASCTLSIELQTR
jgi:hypothetical protein